MPSTTTKTTTATREPVAWPAHATTAGIHPKAWHAADTYEAARAAGCTLPSDLADRVHALATAANWTLQLEDMAGELSSGWDVDALAAAHTGQPMPDVTPLMQRDQLLAVRGEVAQRISAITSTLTTGVVAWLRDNDDTFVTDCLRPRFTDVIDQATPLADDMPATVRDDASALRAGRGDAWLALEGLAATYRLLIDSRQALAEITGWPATDPRRVHLIGARTTMHALDREPQHPVARFAHRVRNRDHQGLWMPTTSDVTAAAKGGAA